MDHSGIKWCSLPAQFISANTEIPPDIIFKFKDVSSDDGGGVGAHKMILAMVSQTFRNMFYVVDTIDRLATEILIEDTTKPAFQIMIDAVYNAKPMKDSLKGLSIHEIFAVLYLVTKYEIHDLVLKVEEFLSAFPITKDTVLEVATDATEYLNTFEAAAKKVLFSCAKFLKPKFPTAKSRLRFVAENGDRISTVDKLVVLMDGMTSPDCSNCEKEACLNGTEIQVGQFREGLKVAFNPADTSSWAPELKYWTGEILNTFSNRSVRVFRRYSFGGECAEVSGIVNRNIVNVDGKSTFIFNCN